MGDSTNHSSENASERVPRSGRVANLRARTRRGARALPWSEGSIFLVSMVMVLVMAPIWVDPFILRELSGDPSGTPAVPEITASPEPGLGPGQPVNPPPGEARPTVVVRDTFSRTEIDTWGRAELGGAYTVTGLGSEQSVRDGAGVLVLPEAGSETGATLSDTSFRNGELLFSFSFDALPGDGALYLYAVLRGDDDGVAYRPKVFVMPDGSLYAHVGVMRHDGQHSLGRSSLVPGVILEAGDLVHVRSHVSGSDPTVIYIRAWADGQAEPEYWNFGAVDWTGRLQGVGAVGLGAYLGIRHPGGPVSVLVDELTATTTDLPSGRL